MNGPIDEIEWRFYPADTRPHPSVKKLVYRKAGTEDTDLDSNRRTRERKKARRVKEGLQSYNVPHLRSWQYDNLVARLDLAVPQPSVLGSEIPEWAELMRQTLEDTLKCKTKIERLPRARTYGYEHLVALSIFPVRTRKSAVRSCIRITIVDEELHNISVRVVYAEPWEVMFSVSYKNLPPETWVAYHSRKNKSFQTRTFTGSTEFQSSADFHSYLYEGHSGKHCGFDCVDNFLAATNLQERSEAFANRRKDFQYFHCELKVAVKKPRKLDMVIDY
jgi:hypothetical protein